MTKMLTFAAAASLALGLAGGAALADPVGPGWISIEQATQKAKDAGYTDVSKIEADDGRWEGQGVKNGQTFEFHIDPKTGAVSNEHVDD
jgi:uncharacterized membrane protein YkoI